MITNDGVRLDSDGFRCRGTVSLDRQCFMSDSMGGSRASHTGGNVTRFRGANLGQRSSCRGRDIGGFSSARGSNDVGRNCSFRSGV